MRNARLLISCTFVALIAATAVGVGHYRLNLQKAGPAVVVSSKNGGFYGIIVDGETNKPLAGATVTARNTAGRHIPDMLCDSDRSGRFGFELDDGNYLITASHPGYTTRGLRDTGREIEIEDRTSFVNAKLRLWPSSSVSGRVIAGNAGIPAQVVFTYDRDASGAEGYVFRSIAADKDGAFSVKNAPAGVMKIAVTADGFASVALDDIVIKAGQNVDLGEIPLRSGVSLFGQVSDAAAKRAIRGAQITVRNTSNDVIAQTVSDSGGNYRLPALDMMLITFDISAEGYHPMTRQMALKGNANRRLDVTLARAWGLSMNVQNQTNRIPLSTIVTITDVVTNKVVYSETVENGRYSLDTLKGGPFLIEAESPDHQTKTSMRAVIGDDVYIQLKPFGKISVRALDSNGEKLSEGEYRYTYRSAASDEPTAYPWAGIASSEFEIDNLVEGIYAVEIRKNAEKSVTSHEFQIHHGDVRQLTIQLTEGGVLTGHVVTTEGNNVRATVTLVNDSRTTETDSDGYFTFDKMPTDAAAITIRPRGRDAQETKFENIVVRENDKVEREFRVNSPQTDLRAERRARFQEMRERGEIPTPPWGDGEPPWGDGPPPWARDRNQDDDASGEPQKPPWGDGPPPWARDRNQDDDASGEPPKPPWGDGEPPWARDRNQGDDASGEPPKPPWGDGEPPWARDRNQGDDASGEPPKPPNRDDADAPQQPEIITL